MRGLGYIYKDGGVDIDFNKVVDEHELVMQRVVNFVATNPGSDTIFPEKGSNILKLGVTSVIYDTRSAYQVAAAISLEAASFIRSTTDIPFEDMPKHIEMTPNFTDIQFLSLPIKILYASGAVQETSPTLSV